MSLLMEALRKAEEAKRKGQLEPHQKDQADSEAPRPPRQAGRVQQAFTLEEREPAVTPEYIRDNFVAQPPASTNTGNLSQFDDLPGEEPDDIGTPANEGDGELQSYLSTEPEAEDLTPPSPRHPIAGHGATRQQQAAASIFTAKRTPPKNRAVKIMAASSLALLLPLGGGLWWYLGNTASSGILLTPQVANIDLSNRGFLDENPPPTAAAIDPATAAPDTALTEAAQEPESTSAVASIDNGISQPQEVAAVAGAETPPVATPLAPPVAAAGENPAVAPQPPVAPNTVATAAPATTSVLGLPDTSARPSLQISRSSATRQENPQLVSAYAMLQRGDLLAAAQLYQEVLGEYPNNRDALLGQAQVSMRQDDVAAARTGYARLLQLNPRDPLARTGLLQTMQGVNPQEHESELKTLLAEFPDVAPLSYALGNLYAGQRRWSEAQAAYFSALLAARRSGGAIHPDYAFNLAVSLEQLNQPTAALDYYRQANSLALEITPGFDPGLLRSRLAYLEQNQP